MVTQSRLVLRPKTQRMDSFQIQERLMYTALVLVMEFVWMEDGEIRLGLYGDVEIPLKESDFKSKREYDLLREALR